MTERSVTSSWSLGVVSGLIIGSAFACACMSTVVEFGFHYAYEVSQLDEGGGLIGKWTDLVTRRLVGWEAYALFASHAPTWLGDAIGQVFRHPLATIAVACVLLAPVVALVGLIFLIVGWGRCAAAAGALGLVMWIPVWVWLSTFLLAPSFGWPVGATVLLVTGLGLRWHAKAHQPAA